MKKVKRVSGLVFFAYPLDSFHANSTTDTDTNLTSDICDPMVALI